MSHKTIAIAALATLLLGGPATAQEHHMMDESTLPEACRTGGAMADSMMPEMQMPAGMDAAHTALGTGMGKMNADMALGMLPEDIDVAFVCSMIPHHQGAIDMAKAELEHGDDPWARDMAQKVITAQEQEIKDMLAWLEKQGK